MMTQVCHSLSLLDGFQFRPPWMEVMLAMQEQFSVRLRRYPVVDEWLSKNLEQQSFPEPAAK